MQAGPSIATTTNYDRRMRRLERKIDALHGNFADFVNGLSHALAEAFAQQGTLMEWPVFGSAMPYPPPDSPPKSGGHADTWGVSLPFAFIEDNENYKFGGMGCN